MGSGKEVLFMLALLLLLLSLFHSHSVHNILLKRRVNGKKSLLCMILASSYKQIYDYESPSAKELAPETKTSFNNEGVAKLILPDPFPFMVK